MIWQDGPVDARLPRYQQLRDSFARLISNGSWTPDTAIPPEDELAARHGVAVGTVRKAIEGLVADGQLVRRQGRGTFVRRRDFGNALARFFRMTDTDGRTLRPTSRILSRSMQLADSETAEHLGVAEGTPVVALARLRLAAGVPILAESIRLPSARFGALMEMDTEDFGDLLYPLYERACGLVVASARETIRFGTLPATFANALQVAPDQAAVIIDRVAFGFDNAPLEFRRSYGLAERFSYSVDIR